VAIVDGDIDVEPFLREHGEDPTARQHEGRDRDLPEPIRHE